ncbi:hypothetical protein R1sor_013056 [Riccia sorocarpa]|uniref:FCP1 homology domain-containing protein n=1 Tax=Riccia sorocarpa TaxID=122646 RepID=A0ABD3H5E6_9MARC
MGRKSHKEVIPLVCCSDQTFAAFEKFVVSWKLGKIPDVHGTLGRPTNEKDVKVDRDFSQLSVNRFRPVNGLLNKELRLVWTELEKGSICITKPAKLQGPDEIVTLKDICKAIKGKRLLAPIETPISWVPDVNQVLNPLVKVLDLLPRKLLILDVEGLLVYVEGFMDRSSKTVAGDDVGTKKIIRRNGVQEFITRCLELFEIALWTCSDRNL